jgi:alginate biosynthesis protein AlgX
MPKHAVLVSLLTLLFAGFAAAQERLELCEEAGTLTRNTDGSFYYSSDLRYGHDLDDLTVWMKRFNDALKAEGTLLVVVPTPLRGMVSGEVVNDAAALEALEIDFGVSEARAAYHDYVASFEPILGVDLLSAARSLNGQNPGYHLKLDRHWTPAGTRTSAQAVARALLASPAYNALSPPERTAFVTTEVGIKPAPNKVFELIEENCGDLPDALMEMMPLYRTERAVENQDLFATEAPFVVLTGGSFSGEQYNFAGFLSEALGQEVVNNSVSGGGLFVALQDYLLNTSAESQAKVIIWEYRMTDASDTNMRENFTPFRELIPSLYGACSTEMGLVSGSTDVPAPTLLRLVSTHMESTEAASKTFTILETPDNAYIQGENYYLHLRASDLSLVEFDIILSHRDGSVDRAPIDRSTRVSNTGEFFLELSREITSPLREVSLTVPAGVTGTIDAQICKMPGA